MPFRSRPSEKTNHAQHAAPAADRLRALTASVPVGIYELDLEGRGLYFNDRCTEITGLSAEESRGLGWMRAVHPDDRDRVVAEWRAATEEGREFDLEYRFLHSNGRTVWVIGRAAFLRDKKGQPSGLLGTVADISERKRAEQMLDLQAEVITNMPGGLCVVRASDETIVYSNPSFDEMMGYQPGELHGRPVSSLHPPDQRAEDRGSVAEIVEKLASGGVVTYEVQNRRRDGELIWCSAVTSVFDHAEHGRVYLAVQEDITERREAEKALRQAEERFRRAFEDSAAGMAIIEGRGANIGRFLDVNPALVRFSGYTPDELLEMTYWELLHPEEISEMRAGVADLIMGKSKSFHAEQRMIAADGGVRWIDFSVSLVRDETGEPLNAVVQAQDVTDRKYFESELRYLADHDPLTGLFNRRRFEREVEREIASAARYGHGGAMLVLDVDNFKQVNDGQGHAAGDALLVEIAGALRSRLRETDIVARLGGDEFGVILPRADSDRALRVAEDLRGVVRTIEAPGAARVTVSVGVSVFAGAGQPGERIVADADAAMYAAKAGGRDKVSIVLDGEPRPVASVS